MGEFDYINRYYQLSLRKGTRCTFDDSGVLRPGRVVSADGAHINIRFDHAPRKTVGPFHPTWNMTYPEAAA